MEMMDRRQMRLQSRAEKAPSRSGDLRIRILFAAAVWFILAVFSLASHEDIFVKASFSGYMIVGFWGVWTVWLAGLLRRMAKQ
jgi:hypothetical protein